MNVRERLAEAERELGNLVEQREALDRKITGLVQVIEGLKFMIQDPDLTGPPPNLESVDEIGVTDAVRRCLASAAGPMFPTEIRDALWSAGYTTAGNPKNLLVSVHGILDRLEKKGEVDEVLREGQKAYKLVGRLVRAIREEKKAEAIRKAKMRAAFGQPPSVIAGIPPPPGWIKKE